MTNGGLRINAAKPLVCGLATPPQRKSGKRLQQWTPRLSNAPLQGGDGRTEILGVFGRIAQTGLAQFAVHHERFDAASWQAISANHPRSCSTPWVMAP